jgi:FtsZ-interacting cell division protein ZipA
MEGNFLKSPVLPGMQIEHHEHRRLVTILICIVAVAIVLGIVYLWTSPRQVDVVKPVNTNTAPTQVTLNAEEAQQKRVEISSVETKTTKLTPAQSKEKAAQIRQLLEI